MSTFKLALSGCIRAEALGEIPMGMSLMDLKERATIAATKAAQHAAAGHRALARSWGNAAKRLREELVQRLKEESKSGLGGIPVGVWDGSTLRVGSTPVRSAEDLERMETLQVDPKLGKLKFSNDKARIWLKGSTVTVQWPRGDGTWFQVSKYRSPPRDTGLSYIPEMGLTTSGKLLLGAAAIGAGVLAYRRTQAHKAKLAERNEET